MPRRPGAPGGDHPAVAACLSIRRSFIADAVYFQRHAPAVSSCLINGTEQSHALYYFTRLYHANVTARRHATTMRNIDGTDTGATFYRD